MDETKRFRLEDGFGDYSAPEIVTQIEHIDDPIQVVKGIATRTEQDFEAHLEAFNDPENRASATGALHAHVENTLEDLGLLRWEEGANMASRDTFIRAMDFLDRLDQDGELDLAPIYSTLLIRDQDWGQFRKQLWNKTLFRITAAYAEHYLRDRDWGYLLDQQTRHAHKVQFTLDIVVEPEDLAGMDGDHPREQAYNAALDILHDAPAFSSVDIVKDQLELAGVNVT